jgi:uncharacterized protein (DUF58 family)
MPPRFGPELAPWQPTRALGRAVLLVGVCVMLAVVFGRADLIVLATPLALGTAWSLRQRPTHPPRVQIALDSVSVAEGDRFDVAVTLDHPDPVPLDLVVVRIGFSPWLRVRDGDRPFATDLRPGQPTEVVLSGRALRWGYQTIGPAFVYALAADGLLTAPGEPSRTTRLRVHPQRPAFRADERMPVSAARVGVHRSRRPGEGGELAGVRRYSSGDKLRRVDWRVTLRTNEPHVAHTLSDRDAEVVLLLDVLAEAGDSGGIDGTPSVVDTTVRAAAGIAEHYVRQGDRVSLVEYSGRPRHLRAASGRAHLHLVVEWLLEIRGHFGADDPPAIGISPHLIPGSALVVVLSPLLAPRSLELIATLAQTGRVVLVVDTLGNLAEHLVDDAQWTVLAQSLWRLERTVAIAHLREVGVPVAPWAGPGTLDAMLNDMTQMALAPRIGVR